MKDKSKIREGMIDELSQAIKICSQKVKGRCRPSSLKPMWIRTLAYSCQTLNGIIKDIELEDLQERTDKIEHIVVSWKNNNDKL